MSTWILLRGLTREARHWGPLPALLRAATATDSVLPLDLPGNGVFARLRAPLDVADMVGFARLAALQSGVAGPAPGSPRAPRGPGGPARGAARPPGIQRTRAS